MNEETKIDSLLDGGLGMKRNILKVLILFCQYLCGYFVCSFDSVIPIIPCSIVGAVFFYMYDEVSRNEL